MTEDYIPARGDILQIEDETRTITVLVVSPQQYNERVGRMLACLITENVLGYPFEVKLPEEFPLHGVVLSDRVDSLDWQKLPTTYIGEIPVRLVAEVMGKICVLLQY